MAIFIYQSFMCKPPVTPVIESWDFMVTFAENIFLMMTREEVAEVITSCKKNDISYKARLAQNVTSRHGSSTTASPGMLLSRNLQKPRESPVKSKFFFNNNFQKSWFQQLSEKTVQYFWSFFCFKSNKGKDAVIVRITRLLLGNRHAHEKGWSESHIKQEALEKPDR